ncbi:hypothetical protein [Erwinia tracheiphila]|uniref:hypothetical protein n=1 Tax=Erwinia tracheiphila TaxID=65700 RepID=UPI001F3FD771|nr:hypothetical protein [Erwinia tracheiphila]UIA82931.1 hypothetical protein LU604_21370 [Erwinia tracheiphila]
MDASLIAIATIFGALVLGAMSAGPGFVFVACTAVTSARLAGVGPLWSWRWDR